MYTLNGLLNRLRQAVRNSDLSQVADVVRDAIQERAFVPQPGSSRLLHSEPGLTVLHVAVNPGFVSPPHDHRTWAVMGVYEGQEDNTLYLLADSSRRIEETSSLSLKRGDVLTLRIDTVHRIANPLSSKLLALHVYGENIFKIERSAWDLATGDERPFKLGIQ
jgi:predicted metal-dependent enzyme (double-stranded beta helix superfamily)